MYLSIVVEVEPPLIFCQNAVSPVPLKLVQTLCRDGGRGEGRREKRGEGEGGNVCERAGGMKKGT